MARLKLHISHLSPLFKDALALVQNDKFQLTFQDHLINNPAALADTIRDADILYLGGDDYYSREVLSQAKNLKLISFGGTGYESYIDAAAATELGIAITNTPGANSDSVANHKRDFIRAAINQIIAPDKAGVYMPNPRDVKIGLIGFGNIHQALYEKLRGKYDVHFWNRTKIDNPDYRDLDTLLGESNLLSISITANDSTKGFLGPEEFRKMKNNSFGIVNSCRHNLVDERALVQFLNENWPRSYHVDQDVRIDGVIPCPRNPNKVATTPSSGCRTAEAWNKTDMMAFQNIALFANAGTSKYIVNPEYKKAAVNSAVNTAFIMDRMARRN